MKIKSENFPSVFLSLYCLCFSLSIALTQIFLICFALSVLFETYKFSKNKNELTPLFSFVQTKISRKSLEYFYYPSIFWACLVFISCFFSLSIAKSFLEFFKFFSYFLLPGLIFIHIRQLSGDSVQKIEKYFFYLFIGQGIAALHTLASAILGEELHLKVPGPLTESGQIALLFPIMIGVLYRNFKARTSTSNTFISYKKIFSLIFTLISIALILNLKRGPWLSVFFTTIVFFAVFSIRNIAVVFIISIIICVLPPVWSRINDFSDHFFISGGRFDMWKLGFQLIERYPLGIGFGNSDMMRKFDPTLPILHRHMHNNILNITLEAGILSGVAYIWWFVKLIVDGVRFLGGFAEIKKAEFIESPCFFGFCILLSIFGMQISGIVEYNLGDGEIRYLLLVLLGFLISLPVLKK